MSHPDTLVVHAGYTPDSTGAVMPPVYLTSTFQQKAPGEHGGFEYSRSGNPTRQMLERALAELEGGTAGFAFASGLAAMSAVLELLDAGSEIVAVDDLYGGAWRLFERVRQRSAGLKIRYVAPGDTEALRAAVTPSTKLVWIEVPTNPLLHVPDLKAVVDAARAAGAITVADATFATPYLLRPLEYGFDIVVHSLTKYLNGHSDVIGGAAVARSRELADRLGYLQNATGAVLDPHSSFLTMRGLRTLALRMQRHCASAQAIAGWLQDQPEVRQAIYPGLASHPQHALARSQFRNGFGGILSVRLRADSDAVRQFLASLRLFTLAESLGAVESLVSQPWTMSHGSLPEEERIRRGIDPALLRLSVGVEHVDDLIADLDGALKAIR